jgi:hypothetical protein
MGATGAGHMGEDRGRVVGVLLFVVTLVVVERAAACLLSVLYDIFLYMYVYVSLLPSLLVQLLSYSFFLSLYVSVFLLRVRLLYRNIRVLGSFSF